VDAVTASVATIIESMGSDPAKAAKVIVALVSSQIILEQRSRWSSQRQSRRAAAKTLEQNVSGTVRGQKIESLTLSSEKEAYSSPCPKLSADKSPSFLEFWTVYPRKEAKATAARAWQKMAPTVGGEVRLLGLVKTALAWQSQSVDWKKEGGKFIPQPATYLNGGRWNDEPTSAQRPRPRMDNDAPPSLLVLPFARHVPAAEREALANERPKVQS
jgi:hypothetical protein